MTAVDDQRVIVHYMSCGVLMYDWVWDAGCVADLHGLGEHVPGEGGEEASDRGAAGGRV